MNITIETNAGELVARLHALGGNLPLAHARALTRTIRAVRTEAVRGAAQDLGVAQRVVRDAMSLVPAAPSALMAKLWVSSRRLPLLLFGAQQTKTGVSYRLPGGQGSAPHAFLATMRSGHRGVFRRRGTARLPIAELRGPSVALVVRRHLQELVAIVKDVYPRRLQHELSFLLGKQGAASQAADEAA